jgi:LPS O-antigen subunit length determinant protein (WzzB/FepE family)
MKRNSLLTQDDEIDLLEFIRELWKEKILIISVSLLFMAIGYVYGTLQPKIYKEKILLREAPSYLFEVRPFVVKLNSYMLSLAKDFNNEFKINLSSSEILDRFVEQNNKIDEFKINLASKNIDIKKYFKGQLEIITNDGKNNSLAYSLTYGEYSPGDHFLNDFILFVKQETETVFKKQTMHIINDEINKYKENLEIAKKINLENQSTVVFYSLQDPPPLYLRGTKALTYQIAILNQTLNEAKLLKLDYNPVLEKASHSIIISKSPLMFATIAFFVSFFLSFILIFIRFLLKNKY